jgi:predicted nucleic acid-binding protein
MILDTNALSAWGEGDRELQRALPPTTRFEIPVITIGEYLWGLARSRRSAVLRPWLAEAIASSEVLTITVSTAESYATVRQTVQGKGRPIPANDLWIAALALEHQLPILSRDSHFDVIDGIDRVTW